MGLNLNLINFSRTASSGGELDTPAYVDPKVDLNTFTIFFANYTRSGNKITKSGNKFTKSGNKITKSGDKNTKFSDKITKSGNKITKFSDKIN